MPRATTTRSAASTRACYVGVRLAQSSGLDNVGGDGREREKRRDQDEEQQLGRDAEPLQTRHAPAGEPWYIRPPTRPRGAGWPPGVTVSREASRIWADTVPRS